MNLNDFENHIDGVILERGYDYFEDGCVSSINEKSNGEWIARVRGSELYRVSVTVKNNVIVSSRCNCPYDMGPVCKHETAVYYALRENSTQKKSGNKEKVTPKSRIEKLLSGMDKNQLTDIIIDRALEDDSFYNFLIAHHELPGKAESKEYYKKIIMASLNSGMDKYGYIDYYSVSDSTDGAYQVLENAEKAVEKKQYDTAVPMSQAVIEVMAGAGEYMDDSGETGHIVDDAFDILSAAVTGGLSAGVRNALLNYCLSEAEKRVYRDYADCQMDFIEIAAAVADSEIMSEKILKKFDDLITVERSRDYVSTYYIEQLLMAKYNLLIKIKYNNDAEKMFEENINMPGFRRMAIAAAYRKKQYDQIIKLALDGEKYDKHEKNLGRVFEWMEWRYKAYKLNKDREEMRKLSYEFIVEFGKIEYYGDYKKTTDKIEWENAYFQLKKTLYARAKNFFSNILAEILIKENELPELLAYLKKHPSHVEEYQKYFLKESPEEIFALHMINIREWVKSARDRKSYKNVCAGILSLKKIGGIKEAKLLVEEFKKNYNKRPAFMDELSLIRLN